MGALPLKVGLLLFLAVFVVRREVQAAPKWPDIFGGHNHDDRPSGNSLFNPLSNFLGKHNEHKHGKNHGLGDWFKSLLNEGRHVADKLLNKFSDLWDNLKNELKGNDLVKLLPQGGIQITLKRGKDTKQHEEQIWNFILHLLQELESSDDKKVKLSNGKEVTWTVITKTLKEKRNVRNPEKMSDIEKAIWEYAWSILHKLGLSIEGLDSKNKESWKSLWYLVHPKEKENHRELTWPVIWRYMEPYRRGKKTVTLSNGKKVTWPYILRVLKERAFYKEPEELDTEEKEVWEFIWTLLEKLGFRFDIVGGRAHNGRKVSWQDLWIFLQQEDNKHLAMPKLTTPQGTPVTWETIWALLQKQRNGEKVVKLKNNKEIQLTYILETLQGLGKGKPPSKFTKKEIEVFEYVSRFLLQHGFKISGPKVKIGNNLDWEDLWLSLHQQKQNIHKTVQHVPEIETKRKEKLTLSLIFDIILKSNKEIILHNGHKVTKYYVLNIIRNLQEGNQSPELDSDQIAAFQYIWELLESEGFNVRTSDSDTPPWVALLSYVKNKKKTKESEVQSKDGKPITWELIWDTVKPEANEQKRLTLINGDTAGWLYIKNVIKFHPLNPTSKQRAVYSTILPILAKNGFKITGTETKPNKETSWVTLWLSLLPKQQETETSTSENMSQYFTDITDFPDETTTTSTVDYTTFTTEPSERTSVTTTTEPETLSSTVEPSATEYASQSETASTTEQHSKGTTHEVSKMLNVTLHKLLEFIQDPEKDKEGTIEFDNAKVPLMYVVETLKLHLNKTTNKFDTHNVTVDDMLYVLELYIKEHQTTTQLSTETAPVTGSESPSSTEETTEIEGTTKSQSVHSTKHSTGTENSAESESISTTKEPNATEYASQSETASTTEQHSKGTTHEVSKMLNVTLHKLLEFIQDPEKDKEGTIEFDNAKVPLMYVVETLKLHLNKTTNKFDTRNVTVDDILFVLELYIKEHQKSTQLSTETVPVTGSESPSSKEETTEIEGTTKSQSVHSTKHSTGTKNTAESESISTTKEPNATEYASQSETASTTEQHSKGRTHEVSKMLNVTLHKLLEYIQDPEKDKEGTIEFDNAKVPLMYVVETLKLHLNKTTNKFDTRNVTVDDMLYVLELYIKEHQKTTQLSTETVPVTGSESPSSKEETTEIEGTTKSQSVHSTKHSTGTKNTAESESISTTKEPNATENASQSETASTTEQHSKGTTHEVSKMLNVTLHKLLEFIQDPEKDKEGTIEFDNAKVPLMYVVETLKLHLNKTTNKFDTHNVTVDDMLYVLELYIKEHQKTTQSSTETVPVTGSESPSSTEETTEIEGTTKSLSVHSTKRSTGTENTAESESISTTKEPNATEYTSQSETASTTEHHSKGTTHEVSKMLNVTLHKLLEFIQDPEKDKEGTIEFDNAKVPLMYVVETLKLHLNKTTNKFDTHNVTVDDMLYVLELYIKEHLTTTQLSTETVPVTGSESPSSTEETTEIEGTTKSQSVHSTKHSTGTENSAESESISTTKEPNATEYASQSETASTTEQHSKGTTHEVSKMLNVTLHKLLEFIQDPEKDKEGTIEFDNAKVPLMYVVETLKLHLNKTTNKFDTHNVTVDDMLYVLELYIKEHKTTTQLSTETVPVTGSESQSSTEETTEIEGTTKSQLVHSTKHSMGTENSAESESISTTKEPNATEYASQSETASTTEQHSKGTTHEVSKMLNVTLHKLLEFIQDPEKDKEGTIEFDNAKVPLMYVVETLKLHLNKTTNKFDTHNVTVEDMLYVLELYIKEHQKTTQSSTETVRVTGSESPSSTEETTEIEGSTKSQSVHSTKHSTGTENSAESESISTTKEPNATEYASQSETASTTEQHSKGTTHEVSKMLNVTLHKLLEFIQDKEGTIEFDNAKVPLMYVVETLKLHLNKTTNKFDTHNVTVDDMLYVLELYIKEHQTTTQLSTETVPVTGSESQSSTEETTEIEGTTKSQSVHSTKHSTGTENSAESESISTTKEPNATEYASQSETASTTEQHSKGTTHEVSKILNVTLHKLLEFIQDPEKDKEGTIEFDNAKVPLMYVVETLKLHLNKTTNKFDIHNVTVDDMLYVLELYIKEHQTTTQLSTETVPVTGSESPSSTEETTEIEGTTKSQSVHSTKHSTGTENSAESESISTTKEPNATEYASQSETASTTEQHSKGTTHEVSKILNVTLHKLLEFIQDPEKDKEGTIEFDNAKVPLMYVVETLKLHLNKTTNKFDTHNVTVDDMLYVLELYIKEHQTTTQLSTETVPVTGSESPSSTEETTEIEGTTKSQSVHSTKHSTGTENTEDSESISTTKEPNATAYASQTETASTTEQHSKGTTHEVSKMLNVTLHKLLEFIQDPEKDKEGTIEFDNAKVPLMYVVETLKLHLNKTTNNFDIHNVTVDDMLYVLELYIKEHQTTTRLSTETEESSATEYRSESESELVQSTKNTTGKEYNSESASTKKLSEIEFKSSTVVPTENETTQNEIATNWEQTPTTARSKVVATEELPSSSLSSESLSEESRSSTGLTKLSEPTITEVTSTTEQGTVTFELIVDTLEKCGYINGSVKGTVGNISVDHIRQLLASHINRSEMNNISTSKNCTLKHIYSLFFEFESQSTTATSEVETTEKYSPSSAYSESESEESSSPIGLTTLSASTISEATSTTERGIVTLELIVDTLEKCGYINGSVEGTVANISVDHIRQLLASHKNRSEINNISMSNNCTLTHIYSLFIEFESQSTTATSEVETTEQFSTSSAYSVSESEESSSPTGLTTLSGSTISEATSTTERGIITLELIVDTLQKCGYINGSVKGTVANISVDHIRQLLASHKNRSEINNISMSKKCTFKHIYSLFIELESQSTTATSEVETTEKYSSSSTNSDSESEESSSPIGLTTLLGSTISKATSTTERGMVTLELIVDTLEKCGYINGSVKGTVSNISVDHIRQLLASHKNRSEINISTSKNCTFKHIYSLYIEFESQSKTATSEVERTQKYSSSSAYSESESEESSSPIGLTTLSGSTISEATSTTERGIITLELIVDTLQKCGYINGSVKGTVANISVDHIRQLLASHKNRSEINNISTSKKCTFKHIYSLFIEFESQSTTATSEVETTEKYSSSSAYSESVSEESSSPMGLTTLSESTVTEATSTTERGIVTLELIVNTLEKCGYINGSVEGTVANISVDHIRQLLASHKNRSEINNISTSNDCTLKNIYSLFIEFESQSTTATSEVETTEKYSPSSAYSKSESEESSSPIGLTTLSGSTISEATSTTERGIVTLELIVDTLLKCGYINGSVKSTVANISVDHIRQLLASHKNRSEINISTSKNCTFKHIYSLFIEFESQSKTATSEVERTQKYSSSSAYSESESEESSSPIGLTTLSGSTISEATSTTERGIVTLELIVDNLEKCGYINGSVKGTVANISVDHIRQLLASHINRSEINNISTSKNCTLKHIYSLFFEFESQSTTATSEVETTEQYSPSSAYSESESEEYSSPIGLTTLSASTISEATSTTERGIVTLELIVDTLEKCGYINGSVKGTVANISVDHIRQLLASHKNRSEVNNISTSKNCTFKHIYSLFIEFESQLTTATSEVETTEQYSPSSVYSESESEESSSPIGLTTLSASTISEATSTTERGIVTLELIVDTLEKCGYINGSVEGTVANISVDHIRQLLASRKNRSEINNISTSKNCTLKHIYSLFIEFESQSTTATSEVETTEQFSTSSVYSVSESEESSSPTGLTTLSGSTISEATSTTERGIMTLELIVDTLQKCGYINGSVEGTVANISVDHIRQLLASRKNRSEINNISTSKNCTLKHIYSLFIEFESQSTTATSEVETTEQFSTSSVYSVSESEESSSPTGLTTLSGSTISEAISTTERGIITLELIVDTLQKCGYINGSVKGTVANISVDHIRQLLASHKNRSEINNISTSKKCTFKHIYSLFIEFESQSTTATSEVETTEKYSSSSAYSESVSEESSSPMGLTTLSESTVTEATSTTERGIVTLELIVDTLEKCGYINGSVEGTVANISVDHIRQLLASHKNRSEINNISTSNDCTLKNIYFLFIEFESQSTTATSEVETTEKYSPSSAYSKSESEESSSPIGLTTLSGSTISEATSTTERGIVTLELIVDTLLKCGYINGSVKSTVANISVDHIRQLLASHKNGSEINISTSKNCTFKHIYSLFIEFESQSKTATSEVERTQKYSSSSAYSESESEESSSPIGLTTLSGSTISEATSTTERGIITLELIVDNLEKCGYINGSVKGTVANISVDHIRQLLASHMNRSEINNISTSKNCTLKHIYSLFFEFESQSTTATSEVETTEQYSPSSAYSESESEESSSPIGLTTLSASTISEATSTTERGIVTLELIVDTLEKCGYINGSVKGTVANISVDHIRQLLASHKNRSEVNNISTSKNCTFKHIYSLFIEFESQLTTATSEVETTEQYSPSSVYSESESEESSSPIGLTTLSASTISEATSTTERGIVTLELIVDTLEKCGYINGSVEGTVANISVDHIRQLLASRKNRSEINNISTSKNCTLKHIYSLFIEFESQSTTATSEVETTEQFSTSSVYSVSESEESSSPTGLTTLSGSTISEATSTTERGIMTLELIVDTLQKCGYINGSVEGTVANISVDHIRQLLASRKNRSEINNISTSKNCTLKHIYSLFIEFESQSTTATSEVETTEQFSTSSVYSVSESEESSSPTGLTTLSGSTISEAISTTERGIITLELIVDTLQKCGYINGSVKGTVANISVDHIRQLLASHKNRSEINNISTSKKCTFKHIYSLFIEFESQSTTATSEVETTEKYSSSSAYSESVSEESSSPMGLTTLSESTVTEATSTTERGIVTLELIVDTLEKCGYINGSVEGTVANISVDHIRQLLASHKNRSEINNISTSNDCTLKNIYFLFIEFESQSTTATSEVETTEKYSPSSAYSKSESEESSSPIGLTTLSGSTISEATSTTERGIVTLELIVDTLLKCGYINGSVKSTVANISVDHIRQLLASHKNGSEINISTSKNCTFKHIYSLFIEFESQSKTATSEVERTQKYSSSSAYSESESEESSSPIGLTTLSGSTISEATSTTERGIITLELIVDNLEKCDYINGSVKGTVANISVDHIRQLLASHMNRSEINNISTSKNCTLKHIYSLFFEFESQSTTATSEVETTEQYSPSSAYSESESEESSSPIGLTTLSASTISEATSTTERGIVTLELIVDTLEKCGYINGSVRGTVANISVDHISQLLASHKNRSEINDISMSKNCTLKHIYSLFIEFESQSTTATSEVETTEQFTTSSVYSVSEREESSSPTGLTTLSVSTVSEATSYPILTHTPENEVNLELLLGILEKCGYVNSTDEGSGPDSNPVDYVLSLLLKHENDSNVDEYSNEGNCSIRYIALKYLHLPTTVSSTVGESTTEATKSIVSEVSVTTAGAELSSTTEPEVTLDFIFDTLKKCGYISPMDGISNITDDYILRILRSHDKHAPVKWSNINKTCSERYIYSLLERVASSSSELTSELNIESTTPVSSEVSESTECVTEEPEECEEVKATDVNSLNHSTFTPTISSTDCSSGFSMPSIENLVKESVAIEGQQNVVCEIKESHGNSVDYVSKTKGSNCSYSLPPQTGSVECSIAHPEVKSTTVENSKCSDNPCTIHVVYHVVHHVYTHDSCDGKRKRRCGKKNRGTRKCQNNVKINQKSSVS